MADRTELIGRRIVDLPDAKRWIEDLEKANLMFHFEDDPSTIIEGLSDCNLFTPEEATEVRKRVAELYVLDWPKEFECPIGYALHLIDPNWRND